MPFGHAKRPSVLGTKKRHLHKPAFQRKLAGDTGCGEIRYRFLRDHNTQEMNDLHDRSLVASSDAMRSRLYTARVTRPDPPREICENLNQTHPNRLDFEHLLARSVGLNPRDFETLLTRPAGRAMARECWFMC